MADDLQEYMRDVNQKLDRIMERLDMLTRLEERHVAQAERVDRIQADVAAQEVRISNLEKADSRMGGKLEISGRVAAAIWGLIATIGAGVILALLR